MKHFDFTQLTQVVSDCFETLKSNQDGQVAQYIAPLAKVNPEQFALSLYCLDGQVLNLGDVTVPVCLQSVSKPVKYCLALEERGEEDVHQHIGFEPSGQVFNELSLNSQGLPHNPMINAGGIMSCSLIQPQQVLSERFEYIQNTWQQLGSGAAPGFNNTVYQAERMTADRNFALAYFMRENKAFAPQVDLHETLELYFQCCSMELTVSDLAVVAATLARGGIHPISEQRIFKTQTVRHCLSLMQSCGLYNFSGEFAFRIGLPAKSGVSGLLMVVLPGVGGLAIWSPRLDHYGNSVRAVALCQELVKRFPLHIFDY